MDTPLVSIILPTYNGSRYLCEAIDSVLAQTYENLELFIINDGSTDLKVREIALEYQKNDSRVYYLENEVNLGITKTSNRGIALAHGKYIARIDDDDIWCDINKLKLQVRAMEEDPNLVLLGTSLLVIDPSGKELRKISTRKTDEELRKTILRSNQFAHSSILIRKQALDQMGWYRWWYAEDYELWLRLWTIGKMRNLNIFWIKYRYLATSLSWRNYFQQKWSALKLSILYRKHYPNFVSSFFGKIALLMLPQWALRIFFET